MMYVLNIYIFIVTGQAEYMMYVLNIYIFIVTGQTFSTLLDVSREIDQQNRNRKGGNFSAIYSRFVSFSF